jgi:hypothetical protein
MIKLAGITGVALAIALSFGALNIASAQDGTGTPSTSQTGTPTGGGSPTTAAGSPTSPATSGTATPGTDDDPLDVGTPTTTDDGSGGVGGETKAPVSGTGPLGGESNVATGLFFIALSVMAAGAAALLLGFNRRATN